MSVIMRFRHRIGAAFGIESRLDQSDLGPQSAHHLLDDMIAADADLCVKNLHGQMPVAQMPGDMGELARIADADFRQRLGPAEHFDEATIIEHDGVARAQHEGVRQVEQEFEAPHAGHRRAAAMTFGGIEQHGVGAGMGACTLG